MTDKNRKVIKMDIEIDFQNGFKVIVWQEDNEAYVGICNANGFVITDRKLTTSEADKLSSITERP